MKIINIKTKESENIIFTDIIKDNKLYYFFYLKPKKIKRYNKEIKEINILIKLLNKEIKPSSIFNRRFDIFIFLKKIYIICPFYFPIFELIEKCKLLGRNISNYHIDIDTLPHNPHHIGINITPYLNDKIKDIFLKYLNNYEIDAFIKISKGRFSLFNLFGYKIIKIKNNKIYTVRIHTGLKNKINDFEKEINKYLFENY